jgi:L-lysine exporter family protein LysE/ArgO
MGWLTAGLTGFGLSLGLIVAIGPQNVFVLRQGLQRSHVFAVCLLCALCDALLILCGVFGIGALLENAAWIERPMALLAATFIAGYGFLRFRSAMTPTGLKVNDGSVEPLGPTLLATAGFTFLNPHVYLDTLLLIGGASTSFVGEELMAFTGGAVTASLVFFFVLGYGARALSGWLTTPTAWQRIDFVIGTTMVVIALAVASSHVSA